MLFSKILNRWYSNNKRELPWRQTKDPYYIWLSEIILQQTQIKQGLPYYKAFVTEFPSVFHLANAEESQVLKLWQGLGYYSRARNLHATAKHIVDGLDGEFPKTYKELLKLKGVGDYTASAMASICFNEPTAVVDGNVYRFLSRYFGIETPINSSKGAKGFKQLAQDLIDKKNPADFNQAIMEFGAMQCKPQNPNCNVCPFQSNCIAFQKKCIDAFPVKIKPNKASRKHFNFLVFVSKDERTILEKRKGKGIWQNLFQFPLIETEKVINFKKFRAILEDNHLLKGIAFELALYNENTIIHKLSHQHLYTKFWIVNVDKLLIDGIPIEEVLEYPVPKLISNFIDDFNF
ncbi:A/G-specific adenine glycosylase [Yeosuana sp.]|uniref:A/G-specific adenine glycosylase n=1 Tax=Yeosuana sp. TaxID=2529388 RepID=UPI004054EAE2|tara:strand:- start:82 stop:1122 length:1041 start_codon:yes stop_codon:yes gene_type:complete